MKRRLKQSVVYSMYAISFLLLIGGIIVLNYANNKDNSDNYQYVSKGILDYEQKVPVVTTEAKILRPYIDTEVKVVRNFYNYKSDSSDQEKALIYYEGTYLPSSGIGYSKGEDSFDVVSIFDGKVKEVKNDEILGNIVTIEHENGLISIYQSISDITVKDGDNVVGGQVIAKSSTSNISKDLGNHLYFEMIINGTNVNPEDYYNKSINEL